MFYRNFPTLSNMYNSLWASFSGQALLLIILILFMFCYIGENSCTVDKYPTKQRLIFFLRVKTEG